MGPVKSIFSGLLGGGVKAAPTAAIRAPSSDDNRSTVDPNRSSQVAEARRRRLVLSNRTGRSALRVDLSGDKGNTRSGISI